MRSTPMVRRALRPLGFVGAAAALCVLAPDASAQFNNQWVSFTQDNSRIVTPTIPLTENLTEVDVDHGDVDQDGWIDLVAVRKQDFTSPGKRRNLFLKNVNGVLTDMTSQYATASTVVGDNGFNTPTNDRDVILADLNNDGWLDFAIATTLSDGDPKHIGHPRIYMNLGDDVNGNWLGFRFENERFPQMFSFFTGNPQNPRFCSVAIGDVTNDGFADLYFGDYDSSGVGSGSPQPAGADMNNRLIINNGSAFFADETSSRLTTAMAASAFGAASELLDMNGDGLLDIVKQTALQTPQHVAITYNGAADVGQFDAINLHHAFHNQAPYHIDVGDLNNDGRLDIAIADDFDDRYRFNTGNDAFGRAIWSGAPAGHTFSFLSGGDDGFASNTLITDLNGDGFRDILIADVDVDIGGYTRRLHIYHNMLTTPGQTGNQMLREERQSSSNSGWIGAVGIQGTAALQGTHDIAVFDIDNDGDQDLIVFRRVTTEVYMSNIDPITCQTNLGFGGPGATTLSVCGQELAAGNSATMLLDNAPAGMPTFLTIGLTVTPFPLFGGTIASIPLTWLDLVTNGAGEIVLPINGTGNPGSLILQGLVLDLAQPELFQISNAVQVQFL